MDRDDGATEGMRGDSGPPDPDWFEVLIMDSLLACGESVAAASRGEIEGEMGGVIVTLGSSP